MDLSEDGINKLRIPYAVKVFDCNKLRKKPAPSKPGQKGFRTQYDLFKDETHIVGRLKNPYINKAFFLHEDFTN